MVENHYDNWSVSELSIGTYANDNKFNKSTSSIKIVIGKAALEVDNDFDTEMFDKLVKVLLRNA